MRFEEGEDKKMQEHIHTRSKSCSFPEKQRLGDDDGIGCPPGSSQRLNLELHHSNESVKTEKKLPQSGNGHSSLKQEILELEKRLQNQFDVRRDLEKALGYRTSSKDGNANVVSSPKPATELIKEIALLELEVSHLEQYLLSLYRKTFDQQISSVSPPTSKQQSSSSPNSTLKAKCLDFSRTDVTPKQEASALESRCFSFDNRLKGPSFVERELDSNVRRCQSSLNQRSAFNNRISPPEESLLACHSQPLSIKEYMQNGSSMISLADHLGTRISDHVPITPNKLSEDMIKCASAIYCKLANPPVMNHVLSSPSSSPSSNEFSLHEQYDMWSSSFRKNSYFDGQSDNQFEFSGPYSSMAEVLHIYRNRKKGRGLELMLRNFSSLISQLEGIDLRNLTHQEKLAFWINVHNALVMHTFLAYGIPQNNGKRFLLLSKPAYNIGGRVMSVETIQSSILCSRLPRPGQWFRFLLTPRKFRTSDEQQELSLDHPEPLLHFALCSGSHSDPAIRVYTHKRVYQELETAKEEYIRATFGIRKGHKILLPKIIESFRQDSGLSQAALLEIIQECLPEPSRKSVKKFVSGKTRKSLIEWIPHNFGFRYLIAKELIR
ncbi:PREDICTED: uncharacterized protein LOC104819817 [Tarenaya hassleriana]|uniref:uncharacterized protein LOC104819817 n=1 Tax=Tarenaya hassleriana TaxID=28532 RepID=UPI00053C677E|nr:PREDICTED: uncharacterized protein LOC104819817 [Tarenaya hassleriana]